MTRTGLFLSAAAILALVAVVAGVPRLGSHSVGDTTTQTTQEPWRPVTADGTLKVVARLSHPSVSLGRQDEFATVDVNAIEVPATTRSNVNLALVIDRSGSMSGFKLEQAKQAARQLISQLGPRDRLAIVHYGSDVKSLDGSLASVENKERMLAYVDGIWDDGGTNIGAALMAGRDLLASAKSDYKVNRLILVSDGQPTEGLTDADALTGIVRETRALGISVSSLGVGDDFNEQLMSALAEVGAGAYGYLQDAAQLANIFQKDLNAASTQVARNVSVSFKAPRGAHFVRVLGYSQVVKSERNGVETVTISMPDFAAGQHERLVAQFTVDAAGDGEVVDVAAVEVSYEDVLQSAPVRQALKLAAVATSNAAQVAQSRDKEAVLFAARARAAENSQQAAERLTQGDRTGAEKLLSENKVLFDEASTVAGEGAVADDLKQQAAQVRGLFEASDQDSARKYKKAINTESRRNFGLMGSTY